MTSRCENIGNTTTTRPCNVLSGVSTLDLSFTPLVPNLQQTIQKSFIHVIMLKKKMVKLKDLRSLMIIS